MFWVGRESSPTNLSLWLPSISILTHRPLSFMSCCFGNLLSIKTVAKAARRRDAELWEADHWVPPVCLWRVESVQNISRHASTSLPRCINFKVLAVVLKPLMASAEGPTSDLCPGVWAVWGSRGPTRRMIGTDGNFLRWTRTACTCSWWQGGWRCCSFHLIQDIWH